jgi:hypothetical protein
VSGVYRVSARWANCSWVPALRRSRQKTDFTARRVAIDKLDGRGVAERDEPRTSFAVEVDGIVLPTTRRAFRRDSGNRPITSQVMGLDQVSSGKALNSWSRQMSRAASSG